MLKLLGLMIESKREERGMTQKELAEKAGVSRPSITQIEGLFILPSENDVTKIAKALGEAPERYVEQLHVEQVLLKKAHIGKSQNSELLKFSCVAALFKEAQQRIKFRSFAGVLNLSILRNELIEAEQRGVSIQLLLAEPNLRNLHRRSLRPEFDTPGRAYGHTKRIKNLSYLASHIQHHQLRLQNTFSMLRLIQLSQPNGNLELRLWRSYPAARPEARFVIFDETLAIEQCPPRQMEIIANQKNPRAFGNIERRFEEEWNNAIPFDLENPRAARRIFSEAEIQKFLKQKTH